jgi:hypothetical protein
VDDLYIEDVETQGGGYRRCVICGGIDDFADPAHEIVVHTAGCTQEFRKHIAQTVGYV